MATTRVFSNILEGLLDPAIRVIANEGGTSSSKTYSSLQAIICHLTSRKKPELWSVVSESLPHLKQGAIRDFEAIMGDNYAEDNYNRTDHIYTFANSSKLEFFSTGNRGKVRGPRRDGLYINEANYLRKPDYDDLDVRTKGKTLLDWNPTSEFWYHDSVQGAKGVKHIHSTYKDALDVLDQSVIDKIEARRYKDPNWWRIFGEGLVGKLVGLVHPVFETCEEMPAGGEEFFGLDFGFSNDPSALVHCKVIGDSLYCRQLLYKTGLTNQDLSRSMLALGMERRHDEIFADCAEPKSIEEIRRDGWNIKPAPKGPDSVRSGIDKLNQYRQYWTVDSIEAIKEQRNYRYVLDINEQPTSKPGDDWNHLMDARRYAITGKLKYRSTRSITSPF